ncbi:LADA_0H10242g1_1 [Lachancea dasiensis]|uniref:LADA_0H10242g1_1 n=1 Tax=Lachancea dasiensis TaxID=1072105 RepID=A0A1G4K315_9SACH|nr:LADA_0H10242g1_1 [Lachancea dasiensis]
MIGYQLVRRTFASNVKCLKNVEEDTGYLVRRLAQLKDENLTSAEDPLHKLMRPERLEELHESLPQKTFQEKFLSKIAAAKLGSHLSKEARETALAEPWSGEEHFSDASLRMLVDRFKDKNADSKVKLANLAFKPTTNTVNELKGFVPKNLRNRRRLESAQDSALNYQMEKNDKCNQDREASEFRAMYAEKFTPVGSFEKLRSLADVRIEESMRKGEFDTDKLKGRKLDVDQPKPYIDRTEHHLNDIMARQKINPPWIDKQGSVNKEIELLRSELDSSFRQELTMEMRRRNVFAPERSENIFIRSEVADPFKETCFEKWKGKYKGIAENKIRTLNNSMRSYNLQAPLSTQKFYLLVDKELSKVAEKTDVALVFQEEILKRQLHSKKAQPSAHGGGSDWLKKWRLWGN